MTPMASAGTRPPAGCRKRESGSARRGNQRSTGGREGRARSSSERRRPSGPNRWRYGWQLRRTMLTGGRSETPGRWRFVPARPTSRNAVFHGARRPPGGRGRSGSGQGPRVGRARPGLVARAGVVASEQFFGDASADRGGHDALSGGLAGAAHTAPFCPDGPTRPLRASPGAPARGADRSAAIRPAPVHAAHGTAGMTRQPDQPSRKCLDSFSPWPW